MSRVPLRPLALLALLAACQAQPLAPPGQPVSALDAAITVERVSRVFPPDGPGRPLIPALRAFAGGRMDALHLALPPGSAALRARLVLAGVRPRKMREGRPGEVVAERYLALVPPCPLVAVSGAGLGDNATRPGFGCATLANLAAMASDPSDLLGNDAAEAPDARHAEVPVEHWIEPQAAAPPPPAK